MSIQSLLWLLPFVFLTHEFEEIIFLPHWLKKNIGSITQRRIPLIAVKILVRLADLSPASFGLVVGEEFILLLVLIYLTVKYSLYSILAAIIIAYLVHVGIHLAQSVFLRRYVPAVGTGLGTGVYNIYLLGRLNSMGLLNWQSIIFLSPLIMLIIIGNLAFCHTITKKLLF